MKMKVFESYGSVAMLTISHFVSNSFYFQLITTTFKYTLRSTSVRYSLVPLILFGMIVQ